MYEQICVVGILQKSEQVFGFLNCLLFYKQVILCLDEQCNILYLRWTSIYVI